MAGTRLTYVHLIELIPFVPAVNVICPNVGYIMYRILLIINVKEKADRKTDLGSFEEYGEYRILV